MSVSRIARPTRAGVPTVGKMWSQYPLPPREVLARKRTPRRWQTTMSASRSSRGSRVVALAPRWLSKSTEMLFAVPSGCVG
jgi:hypothetical protein